MAGLIRRHSPSPLHITPRPLNNTHVTIITGRDLQKLTYEDFKTEFFAVKDGRLYVVNDDLTWVNTKHACDMIGEQYSILSGVGRYSYIHDNRTGMTVRISETIFAGVLSREIIILQNGTIITNDKLIDTSNIYIGEDFIHTGKINHIGVGNYGTYIFTRRPPYDCYGLLKDEVEKCREFTVLIPKDGGDPRILGSHNITEYPGGFIKF